MRNLNKLPDSDRVVADGHAYELENFENPSAPGQVLKFIEKQPAKHKPECNAVKDAHSECDCGLKDGQLETVMDGTTNEEVLKCLIHRCGCLYARFSSRETSIAITNMEQALMWLEKRTRDRIARGVEGKALK